MHGGDDQQISESWDASISNFMSAYCKVSEQTGESSLEMISPDSTSLRQPDPPPHCGVLGIAIETDSGAV
jgi:hypothetical protein